MDCPECLFHPAVPRYSQNPNMDENFHIKSSMFGCLINDILKSSIFGYGFLLYRVTDVIYNHTILDNFYHPILVVVISFHFWMFLVIPFWMKLSATSVQYWMFLVITFWMKFIAICFHFWMSG